MPLTDFLRLALLYSDRSSTCTEFSSRTIEWGSKLAADFGEIYASKCDVQFPWKKCSIVASVIAISHLFAVVCMDFIDTIKLQCCEAEMNSLFHASGKMCNSTFGILLFYRNAFYEQRYSVQVPRRFNIAPHLTHQWTWGVNSYFLISVVR